MYFSANRNPPYNPFNLELISVKRFPTLQSDVGVHHIRTFIHTTFYSNGNLILANSINEDNDTLIGIRPNAAQVMVSFFTILRKSNQLMMKYQKLKIN